MSDGDISARVLTVDDVIITEELSQRPCRRPDYEAENRTLVDLATAMAGSPRAVFQKLVDAALLLCQAGSAGISVLDSDGNATEFRWQATAGEYTPYLGASSPRDFSPCGTVLDRDRFLLMDNPQRFFPYIEQLSSPVREMLLVPFYQNGKAIGTVWIVAHREDRRFDAEDARIVKSLTRFAEAAVLSLQRVEAIERTERERHEREERLKALIRATNDVVYRMNADWTVMESFVGRNFLASALEPTRDWMAKHIPAGEHVRIRAAISQAIARKENFELEHQVIRADGAVGWAFSRATPVCDANGSIVEWFGTASDTTGRRQAEEALADIRSRMEVARAANAIGTWSWEIPSDRFFGDASLAHLFCVAPADVAGGPLARLIESIHPDDRERVTAQVEQAVADGGSFESDYRVIRTDGTWRWVNARGKVEKDADGTPLRFPGVVIDISARKHAEAELARVTVDSERRKRLYEAILAGTPDFVYVFSLDHRIQYANEALLTMWGYSASEVIGKTFLDIGYPAWHAELHCREIDQVRATKQSIRGEVPFSGTYGRRIYEYIFVPVIGEDGEVEAVAGTTRDVTDRKRFEDELRDSDRKKDDFIALLAHELRNPLAPIRSGLEVMRLAGGDVTTIVEARGMMERQLGHMVRLIDDLLDVSRISRNKMELRQQRVLLADVVESALEIARPLAQEAGHSLRIELPSGPVFLNADLTRLAQVLANLLTNSIKYTPRGGRIELRGERSGREVAITVEDNGLGIPQAFLPRIFEMFSQVDRSIERSKGGLGIGLALVKGLVEMHGGTVSASSEGDGRGSAFTVRLPVVEGAEFNNEPDVANAERSRRRVLVVDDNQDGARALNMMLGLLGDETATAHDGLEALTVAERFQPEVILMDIGMPRMNGLEATRRIKAAPWGKEIAIIALTGWGQENDRARSLEAGCDGHLVKPVELSQLQELLATLRRSTA